MTKENDCRLIFNKLPGLYLILKPDTPRFTIVDMSDAYAKAAMNNKQNIGKGLFEVFTDNPNNPNADGVQSLTASLMKVLETKKPHQMKVLRYDPRNPETNDFEIRYWLPVNTPVLDQDQNIIYIIHSFEDVTDTILLREIEGKAQQDLQRLHQEQSAILESIADGFISIDRNWTVKYWNRQAERIFNISRNDILGRYVWDVIREDHAKKLYECFNEAMEKNKPVHFEKYYAIQNTWLQINAYPSDQGLTAFLVDITKRHEQEELLQASEEKYRYLFHNSPATVIIWTLDDLRIQEVNQTAIDLYGYTRNEFSGMSVLDMRPIEEHERIISLALELKKRGTANTGIWLNKTKGGDLMYMNVSFHKINYEGRDAVLALGTDVTEKIELQKKLDEERRQKQQEITEAVLTAQENERSELGKELHDNINQILTTARLYLEHGFTQKEKQEVLLQHSREYISKAIQEIRQLSRTLMPPSLKDVSLKQELEELFLNLKHLKDYRFEFEFLLEREEIITDPLKLAIFRIIQEQVNNILKHAQATRIFVQIVQLDHAVKVFVKDNGIGFDPNKGPRGLGLRNISSRANLFGGQVEINSQVGHGTELMVIFPI